MRVILPLFVCNDHQPLPFHSRHLDSKGTCHLPKTPCSYVFQYYMVVFFLPFVNSSYSVPNVNISITLPLSIKFCFTVSTLSVR